MLKLVLCGAMALVLGRAALAAPQLELSLRTQASAGAQRVLLSDVADYVAGDEQLWQALSAEPLCLPPVASASVTLAARDILGLLAQRGYDWRAIQLSGAAQVTISSGSYCAAPADIVTLVQAETETQLSTTVSLELLRDLPAVRLASPPDKTKVRFPSKPGWWLPEAVEFYSAGRLQAVIPLTQYVKFTLQTVVTPAGIPARRRNDDAVGVGNVQEVIPALLSQLFKEPLVHAIAPELWLACDPVGDDAAGLVDLVSAPVKHGAGSLQTESDAALGLADDHVVDQEAASDDSQQAAEKGGGREAELEL